MIPCYMYVYFSHVILFCGTWLYTCVIDCHRCILQVSGGEDTDKLQLVLGDYRNVAHHIMRSTNSLMGVERQPPTPGPSGKYNMDNQFDSRNRDPSRLSQGVNRIKSATSQQGQQDLKLKNTNLTSSGSSVSSNRPYSDEKTTSSLGNSSKLNRTDHQRSGGGPGATASSQKSHSSTINSQKLPKPEPANQSVKKESTLSQSTKHPPISNREPLLQSLNQELIGQTRGDANKSNSNSKPVVNSESKVSENSGKFNSVLKEKEVENRNNNSSRNKNRPKIFIPEVSIPFLSSLQIEMTPPKTTTTTTPNNNNTKLTVQHNTELP